MRRAFVFVALLASMLPAAAPGARTTTMTELRIPMSDGVSLAATLLEPTGVPRPWPAILVLHGIGGSRGPLLPLAERLAVGRAVLVVDLRGHGESGGLVSIAGPRDVQDVRELVAWLRARPEVDGTRIGAFGVSLGGGIVLRALVSGVSFAAVETATTWTDLYRALAPGDLPKSGAILGFLGAIPRDRLAPEIAVARDAALSGRVRALRAFAAQRSSLSRLRRVRTPVFMFQGRRDFAFDLREATSAFRLLRGPKKLWLGDFGHSPSRFPGPDIERVLSAAGKWFDCHLNRSGGCGGPVIAISPDPWRGSYRAFRRLPATGRLAFTLDGVRTINAVGKVVRSAPLRRRLETFGSPLVRVNARLRGWSRLVAVLTAKAPQRAEVVVSEGGVSTTGLSGRHRLTIRLIDQATLVPARARLRLTLAASSTKQDPSNLLYLDLPIMRDSARITIGRVRLELPVLRNVISR